MIIDSMSKSCDMQKKAINKFLHDKYDEIKKDYYSEVSKKNHYKTKYYELKRKYVK